MAGFDGNGNYVRPYNWTNDAANGLPIDAGKFDTDGNDVATAFGLCLTRDGQGKPSATLNWAQALNLTLGSDSNIFSVARTGGSNNPSLTVALVDATTLITVTTLGNLNFLSNVNSTAAGEWVNNSTGTAGVSLWAIGNSNHGLDFVVTSTGYSGAYLTGGPTGESMCITTGTGSTVPLSLGTHNVERVRITDAGVITLWDGTYNVATAATFAAATVETGSFTGTLTGCTTSPTTPVYWRRSGSLVTLQMDAALTATSNTTACTITGMTAALAPAKNVRCSVLVQDSGTNEGGYVSISGGSTTITLNRANGTGTFTNSGTKGAGIFCITYSVA